jgi:hypothetical protein
MSKTPTIKTDPAPAELTGPRLARLPVTVPSMGNNHPVPLSSATDSPRHARMAFLLAFSVFAAVSILWALASPLFSVPDESAHAVKAIAQVRGEAIGHVEPGSRQLVVDVPADYAFPPQMLCFAFHSEQPADCGASLGDPGGLRAVPTWVSAYNPIYYYLVGWPSLVLSGDAGIYGMRIASAVLGAAFFGAAAFAASVGRNRRWLPAALIFAGVPMVPYLNGAINPNGVEIVSALALTASVLPLLESYDPRAAAPCVVPRARLWIVAVISAVFLANARALGPLWLVVIAALCVVAVGLPSLKRLFLARRSYLPLAIVAVATLFSVGWTLAGGSLSGQAQAADAPLVRASFLQGAVYMVRATPVFVQQALGYFGWFDAPLPSFAFWFAIAAIAIVLALAFTTAVRRDLLTLVIAAVAALAVPVLVQAYGVSKTGIIWQGRYGLFLYVSVALIAGWVLSRRGGGRVSFLSQRVYWLVAALLWAFVNLAFLLTLRRYVIGNSAPIGGLFKHPQWQPPLGWETLMLLFLIATAAFFAVFGMLARRFADDVIGLPAARSLEQEPARLS